MTVSPRLLSAAILCAVVLPTSSCDRPPGVLTLPGVAIELARLREETLRDVEYQVLLTIPTARTDPILGEVVVSFTRDDPRGHDLVLDFLASGERVTDVRVDDEPVEWMPVNDHVVIPAGVLTEDAGPARVALSFRAGDEALNRNEGFLYTLFVPDRARFSLPVFDQPGLKARFQLTLDLPGGWEAVANAPVADERMEHGRKVVAFESTPPIPTYLFAFAAGVFEVEEEERGGRRMRMFHRETDADMVSRNRDAIFGLHAAALDWLEDYTGIDYPFPKFDFVLIPSFQYGGMEHPGAILYRADRLLLDRSPTQSQILGRASVIAHETAHMWFGDLVTMRWFDDVWMKEVFANFMAAKIVHPAFPDIDHSLRFFLAHHPAAYDVDRTGGANPIRQDLENLKEAGTLYGAIIYQKAPIMMKQLELLVGEEVLRDGLREYLESHAFGNAAWPDLVAILDRLSPEDLPGWSRVWVQEAGRPTVSAVLVEGPEGRVRQLAMFQQDRSGSGRVWPQRVTILAGYRDSVVAESAILRATSTDLPGWEGRRAPDFLLPDVSGAGYALFHLDEYTRAYLVERLPDLPEPMQRASAWVSLWDAVLEGALDPQPFLELSLRGLESETDEQNVQQILDYLGTTFWRLLNLEERAANAPALERTLWAGVLETESSTGKAAFFSAYRRVATTPEGQERLARIWGGDEEVPGVPLEENDFVALAEELAVRGVEGSEGILESQLERIRNPDRRDRFEFIRPSLSSDSTVREAFFETLRDPANREREPWVLDAVSNLHHPLRSAHAERFILPSLELLEEIQRTGDIFFPKRWLDATLDGHNSPGAALVVTEFLASRPDFPKRLREKVLQSADMLLRSADIVHGGR